MTARLKEILSGFPTTRINSEQFTRAIKRVVHPSNISRLLDIWADESNAHGISYNDAQMRIQGGSVNYASVHVTSATSDATFSMRFAVNGNYWEFYELANSKGAVPNPIIAPAETIKQFIARQKDLVPLPEVQSFLYYKGCDIFVKEWVLAGLQINEKIFASTFKFVDQDNGFAMIAFDSNDTVIWVSGFRYGTTDRIMRPLEEAELPTHPTVGMHKVRGTQDDWFVCATPADKGPLGDKVYGMKDVLNLLRPNILERSNKETPMNTTYALNFVEMKKILIELVGEFIANRWIAKVEIDENDPGILWTCRNLDHGWTRFQAYRDELAIEGLKGAFRRFNPEIGAGFPDNLAATLNKEEFYGFIGTYAQTTEDREALLVSMEARLGDDQVEVIHLVKKYDYVEAAVTYADRTVLIRLPAKDGFLVQEPVEPTTPLVAKWCGRLLATGEVLEFVRTTASNPTIEQDTISQISKQLNAYSMYNFDEKNAKIEGFPNKVLLTIRERDGRMIEFTFSRGDNKEGYLSYASALFVPVLMPWEAIRQSQVKPPQYQPGSALQSGIYGVDYVLLLPMLETIAPPEKPWILKQLLAFANGFHEDFAPSFSEIHTTKYSLHREVDIQLKVHSTKNGRGNELLGSITLQL